MPVIALVALLVCFIALLIAGANELCYRALSRSVRLRSLVLVCVAATLAASLIAVARGHGARIAVHVLVAELVFTPLVHYAAAMRSRATPRGS